MAIPVKAGRIAGYPNLELTPEDAARLGTALGTLIGDKSIVVVARDYYPPSRMLKRSFTSGLMSTGATVMDFHAATTPELVYAIKRFGAKAGVQFTISSFSENNVTIKIFNHRGIEYSEKDIKKLVEIAEQGNFRRATPSRIGWINYAEYIHEIYSAAATRIIDSDLVSETALARFSIVLFIFSHPRF